MPINTDVSATDVIPGVYGQIDLGSGSGQLGTNAKSVLLIGYSRGTAPLNQPVDVTGDTDIKLAVGVDSDLAEDARAVFDVPGVRGKVRVVLLPVAEPTGGAATIINLRVVSAPSSGAPGVATAATASGPWLVYVDGHRHPVTVLLGDTLATVASSIVAALNANKKLRWTAAATSGGAFTLTCKHKGKTGLDGIVRIDYGEVDLGIRLSPGTITFTGTTAATGTNSLTIGALTTATAIASGSTPTDSATAVVTDINAGAFAVTAASAIGVVTLYLAQLEDYRIAVNVLAGATSQTAATTFGTLGTGDPDLTSALAIMAGQASILFWTTRFESSSPLGALAQHITTYNNGRFQKNQIMVVCSATAGTAWGAVLAGTAPSMTALPQWACQAYNQPNSAIPAGSIAARISGLLASLDYVAQNMDRAVLRTLGNAPMLIPSVASRPDPDTRNADMLSLGISPVVVFADNQNHIDSAKTTIPRNTALDVRVCELTTIRVALYQRAYINAKVDALLFGQDGGKNFRADGRVHTPYVVTADGIKQCILSAIRDLDVQDLVQKTEESKDEIQFSDEPGDPTVVNFFVPFKPVVNLHRLTYRQSME